MELSTVPQPKAEGLSKVEPSLVRHAVAVTSTGEKQFRRVSLPHSWSPPSMVGAGHAGTEHLITWWPGSRKTTPACSSLSADCWVVPPEFRWVILEMPSHKHEEVYLAILQHTGNQDLSSHFSI